MKNSLLFIISLITLISTGCSDEICELNNPDSNPTSTEISLEEALRYANREFSRVFGEDTRSNANRVVSDVEIYKPSNLTRSANHDLTYYIVNYSSNSNPKNGFAILGGDKRMEHIYAISNTGSCHISDTVRNKPLKMYFEYVLSQEQLIANNDFNTRGLGIGLDPEFPVAEQENLCFPIMTGYRERFHQGAPYNKYCRTATGEQALVGCGPLAMGTVLGQRLFPEKIGDYTIPWGDMYDNPEGDGWAQLFERLGRPEFLHASYGVSATGCTSTNFASTFHKLGFPNATRQLFDPNVIADLLRAKKATIVAGIQKQTYMGHIWVIDGGYINNDEPVQINPDPTAPKKYMFHCVWGHGGAGNGYFLYKYANPDYKGYIDGYDYSYLEMVYGY